MMPRPILRWSSCPGAPRSHTRHQRRRANASVRFDISGNPGSPRLRAGDALLVAADRPTYRPALRWRGAGERARLPGLRDRLAHPLLLQPDLADDGDGELVERCCDGLLIARRRRPLWTR